MAQWIDVGPAEALKEGRPLTADVEGYAVLVTRCGTELFAVENRCTHDGEALGGAEIEDCEIICPRHFARFDLKTGEALTPPAYEPLRTFRVRTAEGRLLVELADG